MDASTSRSDRARLTCRGRVAAFFLLALFGAFPEAAHAEPVVPVVQVRYHLADHPRGADPDFDDSAWRSVPFHRVPGGDEVSWIRTPIELSPRQLEGGTPLGVRIEALATCQVWWDGRLLAERGRVGPIPARERPGPVDQVVHVPDALATPGEHLLALRCSTHYRGFEPTTGFWTAAVGPYGLLLTGDRGASWMRLLSFSGMVLVGTYFLLLFLLDRRELPDLLLALFCLAGAALLVAESWRSLFGYTYDRHLLRLLTVTLLSWLLNVLLVSLVISRFPGSKGLRVVTVSALAAVVPAFLFAAWDPKATAMFLVGLPMALAWCLAAVRRRQRGAGWAAAGLATCLGILLADPGAFIDRTLYPALDLLLVALLAAHALQIRSARREQEEARLRASRLEAELLRRHLQPHFLMNTLTALAEWVEEDPATAVRMIESLAEELRALGDLSARRLIRIEDELRLCRSHLEVMSHRKGIQYRLECDGVDPAALIPPAVFHTLVENAVTHGDHRAPVVVMHLSEERLDGMDRYVFTAPLGRTGPVDSFASRTEEGSGLAYVRARLREAFADRWGLEHGPTERTWRTEILIEREAT